MQRLLTPILVLTLTLAVDTGELFAATPPTSPKSRPCKISLQEAVELALEGADLPTDQLERRRQENLRTLNVHVAYWNLYGARESLKTREVGMRLAENLYQSAKERKAARADILQAREQYEKFREEHVEALEQVKDFERHLREFIRIPSRELVLIDKPSCERMKPDWDESLKETLRKRPELAMSRQDVKSAQFRLLVCNALSTLVEGWSCPSDSWLIEPLYLLRVSKRQAQRDLARSMETLKEQEQKAQYSLALYYRRLSRGYQNIQAARATREAFAEQLKARAKEYDAGRGKVEVLLEAQRFLTDAQNKEAQAIVSYNNARAGFAYGTGSIGN